MELKAFHLVLLLSYNMSEDSKDKTEDRNGQLFSSLFSLTSPLDFLEDGCHTIESVTQILKTRDVI